MSLWLKIFHKRILPHATAFLCSHSGFVHFDELLQDIRLVLRNHMHKDKTYSTLMKTVSQISCCYWQSVKLNLDFDNVSARVTESTCAKLTKSGPSLHDTYALLWMTLDYLEWKFTPVQKAMKTIYTT